MILANIKNAERYDSVHPYFKEVFEFLRTLTADTKEGVDCENYRVIFSGAYADTADQNPDGTERAPEAHRKYIDIHYCLSGSEGIGYAETASLDPVTEYSEEDDCIFLKGECRKILLREGDFCILFPEDAHIPLMRGAEGERVLKAIAKIKL